MSTVWLLSAVPDDELIANIDSDNPTPGPGSPIERFWVEDGLNHKPVFEINSDGQVRIYGPLARNDSPHRVVLTVSDTAWSGDDLHFRDSTGATIVRMDLKGRLDASHGGVRIQHTIYAPPSPSQGLCYLHLLLPAPGTGGDLLPGSDPEPGGQFRCFVDGQWRHLE